MDNARLFPSIPWIGWCGTRLPRRTTFVSTQNYITIQFYANPVADYMTGFVLTLKQYPRRNAGVQNSYFGGAYNFLKCFFFFVFLLVILLVFF